VRTTSFSLAAMGLLASAALADCSGSAVVPDPAPPGASAASIAVPHSGSALVYVADAKNSVVAVFDRDGTQVGSITNGLHYPYGIFVDSSHNLWVANGGDSNVLEYARGGTSPIATLADGQAYTEDVSICPNGDLYVATLFGGVTKYVGRKHHMAGSLSYEGTVFQFVTCDRAGNVFATGVLGTNGSVIEFPGGQASGAHMLPITSAGNLGGIKPDNAGNLLVYGEPEGTVAEYTEAGVPTGIEYKPADQWYDFALSRDGKILLGGDQTANVGVSVTFPGGKSRKTYKGKFGTVWGVAFDPGQKGI
jgi:hypothetical protein